MLNCDHVSCFVFIWGYIWSLISVILEMKRLFIFTYVRVHVEEYVSLKFKRSENWCTTEMLFIFWFLLKGVESSWDSEHIFSLSIQTITNTHTHWNNKIVTIISQPSSGNSWLSSLISTIIGNLKISISNVHIRYEDSVRLVYKYHFNFLCTIEMGMENWHLFIYLFIFIWAF